MRQQMPVNPLATPIADKKVISGDLFKVLGLIVLFVIVMFVIWYFDAEMGFLNNLAEKLIKI